MLLKIQISKSTLSNWLLLAFVLIVLISASVSEFFQAPNISGQEFNRYRYLFADGDFKNVAKLTIKNQLGVFNLAFNATSPYSPWEISYPKELNANTQTLEKIFEALKSIKIRRVYQNDAINMSNFSLNDPLLKIIVETDKGEKNELHFGLINPIDNSTYVLVSDKEAIYHVDSLNSNLEKLGLSDFIDSTIINIPEEVITSITLFKNKVENNNKQITFERDGMENKWVDSKGNELLEDRVQSFIQSLYSLRSQIILDDVTEEQEKKINQFFSPPLYTLVIKDSKNNEFTFEVSSIVSTIPDLKIEKRQNFMIRASNRKFPFIIHKDFIATFYKSTNSFRKIPFKKLFY